MAKKSRKKKDILAYRHESETCKNVVPVGLASYDTSKPKPKEWRRKTGWELGVGSL